MSHPFHRLAIPGPEGEADREACLIELDALLLMPGVTAVGSFLRKWGEPLRELLQTFDDHYDEDAADAEPSDGKAG